MGDATQDIISQNIVSQLVKESTTSIYVADFETDELIYMNEAAEKVLGVHAKDMAGRKCYEFLMRRDSPCPFCHKSMMSGNEFQDNTDKLPLNGRQYRVQSKLLTLQNRKVHAHYVTDVTNLLNKQKELRTLTDHIPTGIGIFYVYTDGRIEPGYINDGYYTMLGESRDSRSRFNGFTVLDAMHPEDVLGTDKKRVYQEVRIRKADDSYIWVSIRADLVERTPERCTFYCAFADIDQLKKMQQQLENSQGKLNTALEEVEASKEQLRGIVEHVPGAMVVFYVKDKLLHLKYISDSCVTISGFTAEETYKRCEPDPTADAHPDSRAFFLEHEWDDIQKQDKMSYTYQILCKGGFYKWVSLNLSPVMTDGELLYYGVLRDVDEEQQNIIMRENLMNALPGGVAIYKMGKPVETLYFSDGVLKLKI